jgi:signal transduction histidine kinase
MNRRKDGSIFPVSLSTSLITDEQKNPVALVGVSADISENKQFEEKFRQVQKMEAVGQLAGGIAHDFNNILTAINGYAELAIMKMESKNPLFKEITGILKAGKRASGLVRQLLAFSRQQMIEPKILEVNHLIVDLDRMLRRLIGEDINVNIQLDENLGNIKADAGQLEQILVNLVVNARDAVNQKTTIAGEKKITIETSNAYLDKEYVYAHPGSHEGMHVCITISDTGIGIKKEVQSKVFEPFFTTKDKIKGTGLGLATVYGIVKQNNGYIYLYSEINKGTTVRIYWPMVTQTSAAKQISTNASKIPGGKETILFVEDNEEVRKFTVSALNTLGYKVLSATQGREAIAMIERDTQNIDLIITDVIMPEMGGKEMAEKVMHISPSAKILFTSGYTDNHIVHSGTLEEDVHFIHKPYSIEGLANKVRMVLDN